MKKKIESQANIDLPIESKVYHALFDELKLKIRHARLQAALSVNREVIHLYWYIGKQINEKKAWGSKFIDRLSHDLTNNFPETHGFSSRNLQRMSQFASFYPEFEFTPQSVAKLPWGHISELMQRVKNDGEREWYAVQCVENGWSRITLKENIQRSLYSRQAIMENKASNYLDRLPEPNSILAQEILKQPYNFDFLGLHDDALEREIEHASLARIFHDKVKKEKFQSNVSDFSFCL